MTGKVYDMGARSESVQANGASTNPLPSITDPDVTVAVIGAGPSGIAMGIKLKQAGIGDFTILERTGGIGGSWRQNTYPGICADSPGFAYQYSFFKNEDWNRLFPPGAEVLAYHQNAAERYGLNGHLQCNFDVARQTWNEKRQWWDLESTDGRSISARYLVVAVGVFRDPVLDPGIPGLSDFDGILQRTASWKSEHDPAGRRIAVIGTGASAVQVVPRLAETASVVDVYQRTPVWCLPKPDVDLRRGAGRFMTRPLLATLLHGYTLGFFDVMLRLAAVLPPKVAKPLLTAFDAAARAVYWRYLRRTVDDQETARRLMPRFGLVVKRPVLTNEFLRAFNGSNTNLVTDPIERITETGIASTTGAHREYDMIVLATGFTVFTDLSVTPPGSVTGLGGKDLATLWKQEGLQAYEGTSLPDFPNRWMMVGPYSWTGTGWHSVAELAADHVVRIIREATRRGALQVQVSESAHNEYMAQAQRRGRNIALYYNDINAGVRSYYVNQRGEAAYIRPNTYLSAIRGARRAPVDNYRYIAQSVAID